MIGIDRIAALLASAPVEPPFRTGSLTHLLSILGCGLACLAFARTAVRVNRSATDPARRDRQRRSLRLFVGGGCLLAWLVNAGYWILAQPFRWEQSLPLHFCQVANLIGAIAVLGGGRLFQSVLYFWATTLCLWAFLTPVLGSGPAGAEFWIFWIYHLFIPLAVLEVFLLQQFRPRFSDLLNASGFTVVFTAGLAVIDSVFGWNYGFVGPSIPSQPTLLDVLGPYPLRLLWMGLLGGGLFFLAWLPWRQSPSNPALPAESR